MGLLPSTLWMLVLGTVDDLLRPGSWEPEMQRGNAVDDMTFTFEKKKEKKREKRRTTKKSKSHQQIHIR